MSGLPVETMDVDSSATSLPNDAPIKSEVAETSAPTDIAAETSTTEANESIKAEVEPKAVVKDEVMKDAATESGSSAAVKADGEEKKKYDPSEPRYYENGVMKTTVQQDDTNKNNSRYDPSVLPVSNDHKNIRAQVEFYFSDTNLPKDKHMMDLTGGAENRAVPIEKITMFGRMKRFQPQSEVVAALKASKFLEVIGEEGREKIIRRVAFDPTSLKIHRALDQSVYVKGFGNEEPSSQFDIEAFFAPYGPTNEVRLRRTDLKLFKGSVFVEFENEDLAKKFLELDPKPLWKGVHILEIMSKKAYTEGKEQDIRDGKIQPGTQRHRGNGRGRGNFRGRGDRKENGDRGDRDPNDWKRRREDDRASGFKDKRGGRDNRGGGRGDRGERRGGNRGRGGDRRGNDRNNDRNRERDDKNKDVKTESKDGEKAEVKIEVKAESNDKKRAREDDNVEQAPAKKVDTKSEVASES